MKLLSLIFLTITTFTFSAGAWASGTWSCEGGNVAIGGTYSSAGYAVNFFEHNGSDVGDITLTGLYGDAAHLMIEIKDDIANNTLFTLRAFKTPSALEGKSVEPTYDWVGGGLYHVTIGSDDSYGSVLCLGNY